MRPGYPTPPGWHRSRDPDLPPGIFKRSARAIAAGLKRAVEHSRRTKGRTKFQSARSMLNLHVNRSGRSPGGPDRRRLEAAKDELRRAFGRPAGQRNAA